MIDPDFWLEVLDRDQLMFWYTNDSTMFIQYFVGNA